MMLTFGKYGVYEGEIVFVNNSVDNSELIVNLKATVTFGPPDWDISASVSKKDFSKLGDSITVSISIDNKGDYAIGLITGQENRFFYIAEYLKPNSSMDFSFDSPVTEDDILNGKKEIDFIIDEFSGERVFIKKVIPLKTPGDDALLRKIEPSITPEGKTPSAIQFQYDWEEEVLSLAIDLEIKPGFAIDWNAIELPSPLNESHQLIVEEAGAANSRVMNTFQRIKIASKDGKPLPKGDGVLLEIPIEPDFSEEYEVIYDNIILLAATGEVLPIKAETYRLSVNDPTTKKPLVSAPELIDLGEVYFGNIDSLFNIEIHNPGTDTLTIRDIKTSGYFYSDDIAFYREALIIPPGESGGWPIRFKKRAVNMVFEGEVILVNNSINQPEISVQLRAEVVYGPAIWELNGFLKETFSNVGEEIDIKIQAVNLRNYIIGRLRGLERNFNRELSFPYWIGEYDTLEFDYKHIVTENDILNSKIDFDFFTSDVTGNEVSLHKEVTLKIQEDDALPRKIEPVIIREGNTPSAIQFKFEWEEEVLSLAFDLVIKPGFAIDWSKVELPIPLRDTHQLTVEDNGAPNSRMLENVVRVKITSKDGKPLPQGEGILFNIPIEAEDSEEYEVNFDNIVLLAATGNVLPINAGNYRLAVNDPVTGIYPEFRHLNILTQNYPNPFSRATTIKVNLPKEMKARLAVYSVTGEEIMVLLDGPLKAGEHEVMLDGMDLKPGLYLYQLQADGMVFHRRMIKR
ncbi:T9SS type A sorting domain-containing protein [Litoribacter ruber]|uniref:T9SS type A sorting domain-containing protein n=1 Tax=Litoribacter ruber TaxID=702568 RepID=UPI001BDAFD98|nr:T9SS type A sorting domain-containing protein [Litoribacter ruber]MBT0810111.1 T9SS type A sorting domain-containing protein [Litoribacter ruber]